MTDLAPETELVAKTRRDLLLEARNVAIHFGGVKAVDGVTLEIEENKIYGILGPNGSGKSTILAGITRLVPLTSGELFFRGREYHKAPGYRLAQWGMARTFQTVRLLPDISVQRNILLGADVDREGLKMSRTDRVELVDRAIERTGLQDYIKQTPGELSYGVQRRVEIARAIVTSPSIFFLDEPTAGMNKSERAEIGELMRALKAENITQLLVEHDVQMMVDTCDYLYAMNSGKLIAQGPPAAVVQDPLVQEAYMGKGWKNDA